MLAILIAGLITCRMPSSWLELRQLAERTDASVFAVVSGSNSSVVDEFHATVRPNRSLILDAAEEQQNIAAHTPWVKTKFLKTKTSGLCFREDDCHASPHLLYKRHRGLDLFNHSAYNTILVLRPDSWPRAVRELIPKAMTGLSGGADFVVGPDGRCEEWQTGEQSPCARCVNDQWLYGESSAMAALLGSFPHLNSWMRRWQKERAFRPESKCGVGFTRRDHLREKFLLTPEGILGKSMRELNMTCSYFPQLPSAARALERRCGF